MRPLNIRFAASIERDSLCSRRKDATEEAALTCGTGLTLASSLYVEQGNIGIVVVLEIAQIDVTSARDSCAYLTIIERKLGGEGCFGDGDK